MVILENINIIKSIFLPITLAYFVTNLITPKIRKIGILYKLTDYKNKREKINKEKVRVGGISIILGFFATVFLIFYMNYFFETNIEFNSQIKLILIISFFYFLLGFVDDLISLSPIIRLFGQFLLASFIFAGGISINNLVIPFFSNENLIIEFPQFISYIITLIWIVGVINAINWMDGLDGLATGATLIISSGFLFAGLYLGNYSFSIIISALIGTCIGFLKFNKYPSTILMGDGGSYFYGFLLSTFGLILPINKEQNLLFIISIILLFVPIFDMFYVMLKRILNKKSPFYPDLNHLHHRILSLGFSHKKTVNLILSLVSFFFLLAVFTLHFYK